MRLQPQLEASRIGVSVIPAKQVVDVKNAAPGAEFSVLRGQFQDIFERGYDLSTETEQIHLWCRHRLLALAVSIFFP